MSNENKDISLNQLTNKMIELCKEYNVTPKRKGDSFIFQAETNNNEFICKVNDLIESYKNSKYYENPVTGNFDNLENE